jgi:hypothetical protein
MKNKTMYNFQSIFFAILIIGSITHSFAEVISKSNLIKSNDFSVFVRYFLLPEISPKKGVTINSWNISNKLKFVDWEVKGDIQTEYDYEKNESFFLKNGITYLNLYGLKDESSNEQEKLMNMKWRVTVFGKNRLEFDKVTLSTTNFSQNTDFNVVVSLRKAGYSVNPIKCSEFNSTMGNTFYQVSNPGVKNFIIKSNWICLKEGGCGTSIDIFLKTPVELESKCNSDLTPIN